MEIAGVKPERLALEWASAAEAPLYVELITQFTNQVKELGPLGEAEGVDPEELKQKLFAIANEKPARDNSLDALNRCSYAQV